MLELSFGELFVVVFVTVAVVSAPWWPKLGAAIAELIATRRKSQRERDAARPAAGTERDASGESPRG